MEKKNCVFKEFESADLIRQYPPFDAKLLIHGREYTRNDAICAWRRNHSESHKRGDAQLQYTQKNRGDAERKQRHVAVSYTHLTLPTTPYV